MNSLSGPLADPSADAGYADGHPPRVGFFTDTSVCIGCKACEVACKEWNALPADGVGDHGAAGDVLGLTGMSYDNSGGLGASTAAVPTSHAELIFHRRRTITATIARTRVKTSTIAVRGTRTATTSSSSRRCVRR